MYSTFDLPVSAKKPVQQQSYVCGIEVEGQVARSMYDEHPGYGIYFADARRCVFVPPYCSLERAIDVAIRAFAVLQAESDERDVSDESQGDFWPSHVVLYDSARNVVFQFNGTRESAIQELEAPLIPLVEHETLLKRVDDLSSRAALERGWDNFSTAASLDRESNAIERQISRSLHFESVVKTETMRGLEIRAAYALTSVLMRVDNASDLALRPKIKAIKGDARRLGYFEALCGVTDSPVIFADCAELNGAWQAGVEKGAQAIASSSGDFAVGSLFLNPNP